MKKLKKSKSKRTKKARKTKKTKKIKKVRKPKKVLKKKKVSRPKRTKKIKKVTRKKVSKPAKVTKKPAAKKPVKIPKPKKVEEAPIPAPAPEEKVPYTQENAIVCICTKCPVQAESTCVGERVKAMEAMMEKGMPEGMMPPPADLPGLYCSAGAAACKDLDFSKMCICGVCPVLDKYGLATGKPMGFFCREGKAV
jgi:hypothetical protein